MAAPRRVPPPRPPVPPRILPQRSRSRISGDKGRGEIPIAVKTVLGLRKAGLNDTEIAAMLGVHIKTLQRRLKKDRDLAEAYERGDDAGKGEIKAALHIKAVGQKHAPTLQFLAKTRLGWTEGNLGGANGGHFLVETRPKAPSMDAWAEQYGPMRAPPQGGAQGG